MSHRLVIKLPLEIIDNKLTTDRHQQMSLTDKCTAIDESRKILTFL